MSHLFLNIYCKCHIGHILLLSDFPWQVCTCTHIHPPNQDPQARNIFHASRQHKWLELYIELIRALPWWQLKTNYIAHLPSTPRYTLSHTSWLPWRQSFLMAGPSERKERCLIYGRELDTFDDGKSTGGIYSITDGCIPLRWDGSRALVLCVLTHWLGNVIE